MKKNSPWKSVTYAIRGLVYVYTHERNFRIEFLCTLLVLFSFLILPIGKIERLVVLLLCAAVLILEIVNSMVEHFLDILKPRLSYQVEIVKDILASMVFVSVIFAFLIGLLIYIPAFIEFFSHFVI